MRPFYSSVKNEASHFIDLYSTTINHAVPPCLFNRLQATADGTLLAIDLKASTLVLIDRTIWALKALKSELPVGLKAGDRIEYDSDEEGVSFLHQVWKKMRMNIQAIVKLGFDRIP